MLPSVVSVPSSEWFPAQKQSIQQRAGPTRLRACTAEPRSALTASVASGVEPSRLRPAVVAQKHRQQGTQRMGAEEVHRSVSDVADVALLDQRSAEGHLVRRHLEPQNLTVLYVAPTSRRSRVSHRLLH